VVTAPTLGEHVTALGWPAEFGSRTADDSAAVEAAFTDFKSQFAGRKFVLGVLLGFIGVVEDLLSSHGMPSVESILDRWPPESQDSQGRPRNVLHINDGGRVVSHRTYYNRAEKLIFKLRRYDYPNCAPHATQAWPQHRDALIAIGRMSPEERRAFAELLWSELLALPEFAPRSEGELTPRPFSVFLKEFPERIPKVPAGAILQGLAFAYYRADAPNVTLETGKVGAGGARQGRVGDVDGWSASGLVLAIEVKDTEVSDVAELKGFLANLAEWKDATAIVLARSFSTDVREQLANEGLLTLDRLGMAENVGLWDVRKQQMAVREFEYFARRVQKNSQLCDAIKTFADDQGLKY
jgi:hypothetical protein